MTWTRAARLGRHMTVKPNITANINFFFPGRAARYGIEAEPGEIRKFVFIVSICSRYTLRTCVVANPDNPMREPLANKDANANVIAGIPDYVQYYPNRLPRGMRLPHTDGCLAPHNRTATGSPNQPPEKKILGFFHSWKMGGHCPAPFMFFRNTEKDPFSASGDAPVPACSQLLASGRRSGWNPRQPLTGRFMNNLETIKAGLEAGEFFLEYLPTVSLADGRCIGAEALVRWRRASGVVPPQDFIPLIENTPGSGLVTYWVIDTLAVEMADWLRANPEAFLSFNVPPEILGRGGMEYVAKKAGVFEFMNQIVVEITERGVPDLMGVEAINNCWRMGLRVVLDDVTFTGGANLAVLARSNFGGIKLDRSLIAELSPHSPSPEWLSAVKALVQSSKLIVIAEGVETEAQLLTLRAANIQAAQGYFFSRPIPAADFIAYHKAHAGDPTGGQ